MAKTNWSRISSAIERVLKESMPSLSPDEVEAAVLFKNQCWSFHTSEYNKKAYAGNKRNHRGLIKI